MKTFFQSLAFPLTLLAAAVLGAAPARAQTGTPRDPYVITTAPYKINKAGYYILGKNLSGAQTSGNLIEITASNVTLDFNGFYLAGPVGNTNQSTVGVRANEQSNVVVKNGTVAYCSTGIYLSGSGNSNTNTNAVGEVVDNMHVTYCYSAGIVVQVCLASRITDCQISKIGYSGASSAYAIYAPGFGQTIQNNTISTVTATASYGIYAAGGSFARQNAINSAGYGVFGGKYQDNLTYGVTTPVSGGTDAGGNN